VKAQKNDDRDAEAIAEAATRPTMRFVELKSAEQLDMQVLHRARDRLVAERTALINQLRAVLMERGIVVPQGRRKLSQALAEILEGGDPALSVRVCTLIKDMREEWCDLDRRICAFDNEFAARGSACSMPPPWWPLSVTARVLHAGATFRLGLASFPGSRLPAASRA
jgi:transposase